MNPLAGMVLGAAVGAGSGALSGSLADYGIDDGLPLLLRNAPSFKALPPTSSAGSNPSQSLAL